MLEFCKSPSENKKVVSRWLFDTPQVHDQLISAVRTPSAQSKFQKRLGARKVRTLEQAADASSTLTPESATSYRALGARCNYLAQDDPDIAFASKELCRDFAAHTLQSLVKLKRVIRYLKGCPRLVYRFPWQSLKDGELLTLEVDTDFAGCQATRRSTSGGVALRGCNCIRLWSATQTAVELTSGEAELGGISKGLSQGIGLRSVAADLGISISLRLRTDATAAIGMTRRLGVGKVRHLDTSLLWVQQHVRSGDVLIEKVDGAENPSDAPTKHLIGADLRGHLARMNAEVREGRPASAQQLTTAIKQGLSQTQQVLSMQRPLDDRRRQHIRDITAGRYHEESKCENPSAQEGNHIDGASLSRRCSQPNKLTSRHSHVPCHECGALQLSAANQCGVCESGLWMVKRPGRPGLPRAATGKPPPDRGV